MTNILFISGLSRSGSSFFSYNVALKFNLFLAGEVITNREIFMNPKLLNRYLAENRVCSCHNNVYTCTFWSKIIPNINPSQTFADYYQDVIDQARYLSSASNLTIVDSSKHRRRLLQLATASSTLHCKLTCIHVLKHYRAQIYSGHKYSNRGYQFIPFRNTSLFHGIYWIYANSTQLLTLFILKKFKLIDDFTLVNYEDFVFSRDKVYAGLTSWKPNIFSSKFGKNSPQHLHEMGGNENFKSSKSSLNYSHIWLKCSNMFSFIAWSIYELFYIVFRMFSLIK